ncbi:MAG TPA: endonuclease/exonuclease/phosphatase family protein [Anaeromyxobacteraceae bacterium]|nr:endonuclease/exonuclease/phosphatase family protein [Anaeromyxobacteraceae bacterium]
MDPDKTAASTRYLLRAAAVAAAALPTALWIAGQRSSSASVAHDLLLVPSLGVAGAALALALRARRRLAAAAALAVLCPGLALCAVRAARAAKPAAGGEGRLSLVTQNLLFNSRSERMVALLRGGGADVLCLQEVTPAWARRLDAALRERYPYRAVEARTGAYGVAIYSRAPLAEPSVVRDGRRVAGQCAAIAPGGAEIVLCNVHLSSPAGIVERGTRWLSGFDANARVRGAQWRLLREHVARRYPSARHLVVAGDFNTLDGEPLYREISSGLVDAFAAVGSGRGATLPTEPTSPFPLVRIDYVFSSPALAPRAASVLPPAGSDHLGLRVELAVPGYSTSSNSVPSGPVAKRTDPR